MPTSQPAANRLRPELLAPAGDRDCIRAAIENGADAVYFGLDCGYNARARAANFEPHELPEIMGQLHSRGVKGYVTLNTLIFTEELPDVERLVKQIATADVDAVLVQDLGLVRLIRRICPELPIHASTQMTLTSSQSIAAAAELGVERVVLARELSVPEIRRIRAQTEMPLEVFVHGALCVAYSGQCLTSESLGGRSANRGQCAQACRLPYDIVCDGEDVATGDQKYLLSPQDLAAYALIPDLIAAGVCSLKIEGRLKTPEYVANITRHYRRAIDAAMAKRPVEFTPRDVEEMELSFSRGFSPGWLGGCDHKMLVPALSSDKRGVLLGRVRRVVHAQIEVELAASVKRGDGVVFDCGRAEDDRQGGRVYEVFRAGRSLTEPVHEGLVHLAFARDALDFREIFPGQEIWKTDDPELTARLRKSYNTPVPQRRIAIELAIEAAVGQPLRISARAETGWQAAVESPEPLAEARKHPLTEEILRDQFGRLGGSEFELSRLTARIGGQPMVPLSILGRLRHAVVEALRAQARAGKARQVAPGSPLEALRAQDALSSPAPTTTEPTLHVLCRSLPQLAEVLAAGAASVLVDFQDIRHYRDAVKQARAAGAKILLATPRIQKPGEAGIFVALQKYGGDGMLVRNLGGLRFYAERKIPLVADFSLNCANELTAHYLWTSGAARITPSYDLNREQLLDLVSAAPAAGLELVIHQHMPMFHMEHCVFCAMLSPGTNKTNCGRPCDRHLVQLRDRIGMEHPLHADVGCRNTLFNAVAQSAAEIVPALLHAGVRHFRVELLGERGDQLRETIALYRQLLAGAVTGKEVWSRLQATNRVGVTRGTLEERQPLAIV